MKRLVCKTFHVFSELRDLRDAFVEIRRQQDVCERGPQPMPNGCFSAHAETRQAAFCVLQVAWVADKANVLALNARVDTLYVVNGGGIPKGDQAHAGKVCATWQWKITAPLKGLDVGKTRVCPKDVEQFRVTAKEACEIVTFKGHAQNRLHKRADKLTCGGVEGHHLFLSKLFRRLGMGLQVATLSIEGEEAQGLMGLEQGFMDTGDKGGITAEKTGEPARHATRCQEVDGMNFLGIIGAVDDL